MVTRGSKGVLKPNPQYALMTVANEISILESPRLALLNPKWKDAINLEFSALMNNRTWTLIPRDSSNNVINTKWVFKVKQRDHGTLECHKARLVENGMR